MKLRAGILVVALVGAGCVHYSHEFPSPTFTPSACSPDGCQRCEGKCGREKTSFTAFIFTGSAGKIRSTIKLGTNYSRDISVGNIQGRPDNEFIEALGAGVARGTVEALKKSGGVP